MYGFDAINASNGWSIAAVGVIIVFAGLVILSLIISQLHKVLSFIENPDRFEIFKFNKNITGQNNYSLESLTKSQKESAKQFYILFETFDSKQEYFSLPKLLHIAEINGLGTPYNSLNNLLESGIIEPDAKGYFLWNKDRYKKLVT